MRGPPPEPAHLKLLKGNPGQRRIRPEPEPELFGPGQLPAPPEFLNSDAQAEWRRLAPELVRLRLLTPVDTALFACYCTSFAHWKAAVEALQAGVSDPLVVEDADGTPHQNPLVKVIRSAGASMLTLAREFGLTPIARARLAQAGFTPPPNGGKFVGLIAG
jgi:P27 family predicted phage terminase small subunit